MLIPPPDIGFVFSLNESLYPGIDISVTKSDSGVSTLDCFEQYSDAVGIRLLEDKVNDTQNIPGPTSVARLREFIGLVNNYRCFNPECA